MDIAGADSILTGDGSATLGDLSPCGGGYLLSVESRLEQYTYATGAVIGYTGTGSLLHPCEGPKIQRPISAGGEGTIPVDISAMHVRLRQ